jgi:hypothetical protein
MKITSRNMTCGFPGAPLGVVPEFPGALLDALPEFPGGIQQENRHS